MGSAVKHPHGVGKTTPHASRGPSVVRRTAAKSTHQYPDWLEPVKRHPRGAHWIRFADVDDPWKPS
jgi:hypothetical protein